MRSVRDRIPCSVVQHGVVEYLLDVREEVTAELVVVLRDLQDTPYFESLTYLNQNTRLKSLPHLHLDRLQVHRSSDDVVVVGHLVFHHFLHF